MLSEIYNIHTVFLNKVTLKNYLQYDRINPKNILFSNLTDENGFIQIVLYTLLRCVFCVIYNKMNCLLICY